MTDEILKHTCIFTPAISSATRLFHLPGTSWFLIPFKGAAVAGLLLVGCRQLQASLKVDQDDRAKTNAPTIIYWYGHKGQIGKLQDGWIPKRCFGNYDSETMLLETMISKLGFSKHEFETAGMIEWQVLFRNWDSATMSLKLLEC